MLILLSSGVLYNLCMETHKHIKVKTGRTSDLWIEYYEDTVWLHDYADDMDTLIIDAENIPALIETLARVYRLVNKEQKGSA